jgi:hypothetical protein
MKILVAMPLHKGSDIATQAIDHLVKTESDQELSFAFLIHEEPRLRKFITSTVSNSAYRKRFSKSYILKAIDSGFPIQNLASLRNKALDFARKNSFDALWFVDSDILVNSDYLDLLLNVNGLIIGGLYRPRAPCPVGKQTELYNATKNSFSFDPEHQALLQAEGLNIATLIQPFKVTATGAGCLLIKSDAFREEVNFDITEPFFGEDFNFCLKAQKFGFDVKVHPLCFCEHIPLFEMCSKNDFANKIAGTMMLTPRQNLFPAIKKYEFFRACFWCSRKTVFRREMVTFNKKELNKINPNLTYDDILLVQLRKNKFLVLAGSNKVAALDSEEKVSARCFTPYQEPRCLPVNLLMIVKVFTVFRQLAIDTFADNKFISPERKQEYISLMNKAINA